MANVDANANATDGRITVNAYDDGARVRESEQQSIEGCLGTKERRE